MKREEKEGRRSRGLYGGEKVESLNRCGLGESESPEAGYTQYSLLPYCTTFLAPLEISQFLQKQRHCLIWLLLSITGGLIIFLGSALTYIKTGGGSCPQRGKARWRDRSMVELAYFCSSMAHFASKLEKYPESILQPPSGLRDRPIFVGGSKHKNSSCISI
ncbi:uncharacterized protein BDV14DRAFT_71657 [Aspergillus stella-maris]|uniref:uncharacterized protein n=1 Tax=Aspergillus stella-maris TaxID=1810926 RepID=UPI003CCD5051